MGNPILPAVTSPWGDYLPGTPNNLQTVSALLGDAGDTSDGFDDAMAAIEAELSVTDALEQAWLAAEAPFETAADVYMAITDEISGILATATALYDVTESGLGTAILALAGIGAAPQPPQLPPPPGLPNVNVPQPVDISELIAGLVSAQLEPLQASIETITADEELIDTDLNNIALQFGLDGLSWF